MTGLIFGVFSILVGIYPLITRKNVMSNGVHVDAKVAGIERKKSFSGKKYFMTFEYEVDGVTYVEEFGRGEGRLKHQQGDTVRIICHKDDPKRFVLEKDTNMIFLSVTFIIGGIIIALSSIGIF